MSQHKVGALLSYVYVLINILTGLLFTPYIIHALGRSEYGLYSLVGSLIANLAILDLGLNDSVVRYVAKYRAANDRASEENFLGLISVIYSIIALVAVTVGIIFIWRVPNMFPKLTLTEVYAARVMLSILTANVATTIVFNAIGATVVAYESFILLRTLEIGSICLSYILIFFAFRMGFKSIAMVAITAMTNAIVLFVKVFYAIFKLKVRIRLGKPDKAFLREIFQYSMAIATVVVVEQIYWKLDGVILGVMMTTEIVAVYAVGMSFSKYFMSFSTSISKVLMPRIVRKVELGASGKELTDLLIKVSRIQALMLLPVMVGLIAFGNEFIRLWLGDGFSEAYWVMVVTIVPYSLDLIGNTRNQIMQAKGVYWYRSITILIISLVNVVVTILLIRAMGMVGAAISTGVGIFIGYIAISRIISTKIGIDVSRYGREVSRGILPATLCSAVFACAVNLSPTTSWALLGLRACLFALVYATAVWYIGMHDEERQMIRDLMPTRLRRRQANSS